ncbi:hypothetical protein [Flavobacterium sp. M31R6]|nr:hypothetical protein [Flavobacterium sp. M31R6]
MKNKISGLAPMEGKILFENFVKVLNFDKVLKKIGMTAGGMLL